MRPPCASLIATTSLEVQNENPTFSADFINILQDEELDDDSRQRL